MTMGEQDNIAVIGAGSWGTALARLLAAKGKQVYLWSGNSRLANDIAACRENKKYLPGAILPDSLIVGTELEPVTSCSHVVMVIPSHGYREVFRRIIPYLQADTLLVSAVKGIEIGSRMTMTQVMKEEMDTHQTRLNCRTGVLSGPSFADEVAADQPTAVTVAFADREAARSVQHLFSTGFFRVYTSSDVIGLEICGAMKNVIAIAAGISDGLGFGLNTRAALITRGLVEIARLGRRMGANPHTFYGLGGLGDLVLTCTGNLSRNRTVGLKLGSGKSLEQALAEMTMVAEGVRTTRSCYNLASSLGVEMPILEQVWQVLYNGKNCRQAVQDLLTRDLKDELE